MKNFIAIGIFAVSIGFASGFQVANSSNMNEKRISIVTFRVKSSFDSWLEGFESKPAQQLHKQNAIKPLYRGFNPSNPRQVIVIHQAEPGIVEDFLDKNADIIKGSGHLIRTTKISNWTSN